MDDTMTGQSLMAMVAAARRAALAAPLGRAPLDLRGVRHEQADHVHRQGDEDRVDEPAHLHPRRGQGARRQDGGVPVEGGPPNALFRQGWRKDTLKPGDTVTVSGIRAKIPTSMNIGVATITTADGKRIYGTGGQTGGARRRIDAAAAEARAPNQDVRADAYAHRSWLWSRSALRSRSPARVGRPSCSRRRSRRQTHRARAQRRRGPRRGRRGAIPISRAPTPTPTRTARRSSGRTNSPAASSRTSRATSSGRSSARRSSDDRGLPGSDPCAGQLVAGQPVPRARQPGVVRRRSG